MGIRFELTCAMCAMVKYYSPQTPAAVDRATTLERIIDNANWICQQNGENFDIYCCEECAE